MHLIQNYITDVPAIIFKGASLGGTGVHIFFFCSGMGLYMSYIGKREPYRVFLIKRFKKIYLPYIVVVCVSVLFPFVYQGNRFKALLSHIFLYKMFSPVYENSFGGQFWYLSTLFQFYFLFYFFCSVKQRVGNRWYLAMTFAASMFWWIITVVTGVFDQRIWSSFFLQYLWEFALGMAAADVLRREKGFRLRRVYLLPVAAVGGGAAALTVLLGDIARSFNDVPMMLGYGAIALWLYSSHIRLVRQFFLWLSGISFAWYLLHILVFECVYHLVSPKGLALQCIWGAAALSASLAAAYGYDRLLKKAHMI